MSFILHCFRDEFILNVTLISCRSITRSRNVVLPVCRANVLNSCMHSCALSSDGGACDSIDSLSLLSLSLAVHDGAHSASSSLVGRSQSVEGCQSYGEYIGYDWVSFHYIPPIPLPYAWLVFVFGLCSQMPLQPCENWSFYHTSPEPSLFDLKLRFCGICETYCKSLYIIRQE